MFIFFVFFFKQKTAYEMLRSLVGSEMCIRDRDYALNRYVANGSRIQETAKTILNQKELATVSEISGYGKFMQCVGTIVSA